ncbi:uncharacterized protein C7orf57-like [Clavelina lepadiformis]|uniref:uncharacterized protein C7orf57-like n=1 Tax=Clavelina lepadiformis TaxID=159417 RepID=UPI004041331C
MLSKGGGQDWFYHAPISKAKKEKQFAPVASQIPGLTPDDIEAMERETGSNKRNWIRDTDTKYIQLAKLGGRKNLLTFNAVKKPKGPKSYPRVDWFDHEPMSTEEEKKILAERKWFPPEYMIHESCLKPATPEKGTVEVDLGQARRERLDIQEKYERRGAPFYMDGQEGSFPSETTKLPKISKQDSQKPKEVEFSKLMSGGYGEDWYQTRSRQQKKKMKKWENQNNALDSGMYNLTEYQQNISKRELPRRKLKPIAYTQRLMKKEELVIEKEPFKLSKFTNVRPRLATREVVKS